MCIKYFYDFFNDFFNDINKTFLNVHFVKLWVVKEGGVTIEFDGFFNLSML